MRIAFFSDNFYPELSGITDTITTTSKELRARGHEVCYVVPYYAPAEYTTASRQYPLRPEDDTIEGAPIVRLPSIKMPVSPTGQSRLAFPTGASFEFLDRFKPDIIHTNSPYGAGWEAVKAARRYRVPLIGTNHTAIEDFFPFGLRTIMRWWDARYYNHCSFTSAPYGKLLERMGEMGFTGVGHAVANPADLHEFTPATLEERREHRAAFGITGPTILYAGRLGTEKRVEVMIRATAILKKEFPDVTFMATGHGAARPSLEMLVQKLGIGRNVRFTGYLSRAALPHAYKAADIFGMTSTSDSQSLALMQGYSTAMPAVTARARGLPDYTPPEVGFQIAPRSAEEFAEKAALLLRDETLRTTMGQAALQFVHQFAPNKIAAQWESIYMHALENR